MPLAFYRLKPTMAFRVLLTALIAYIIAFVPNYQKDFYQNTPAVNYDKYNSNAGFPAGEGYPVASSIEDLETYDNYILEIDAEDMQETHLYEYIFDGGMFTSSIRRFLFNNLSDYGMGQYYAITLESGEKVLVLLDDTALKLSKTGRVTLPVGETFHAESNELFDSARVKYQITSGDNVLYVDMVGDWRKSEQAATCRMYTGEICTGTMLLLVIMQIVVHIIYKKVKNTNNKTN